MVLQTLKLAVLIALLTHSASSCNSSIKAKLVSGGKKGSSLDLSQPVSKPIVTVPAMSASSQPEWSWTAGELPGDGTYRFALSEAQLESATPRIVTTFKPTTSLVDGEHTLFVQAVAENKAEKESGKEPNKKALPVWSAVATATVMIDTVPPTFSLTSSTPEQFNTTTMNVSITASEAVTDFIADDLLITNGAASNFAGSGTTYAFDILPAGEGTVTIAINADIARDAAGNGNAAATNLTRVYDTIAPNAPAVSGATPTNNAKPMWSWVSGFGGGNLNFRIKLDDADLTTGATDTTETIFTPPANLTDGLHTLYVQERDDAGNWSASGLLAIIVDSALPTAASALRTAASTGGADIRMIASTSIALDWTPGSDLNSGVASQTLTTFAASSCAGVGIAVTGLTPAAATYAFTGTSGTTHSFKITTLNNAGSSQVSTCSVAILVDTSTPISPATLTTTDSNGSANKSTTYGTTLYFEWNAGSDSESGVRDYTLSFYNASSCGGAGTDITGNTTRTHSITPNVTSTYSFKITTFNNVGLSSVSSCSGDIAVTVPPPSTAPTGLNALAANITDAAASLTWSAQGQSATYKLERAPYAGSCGSYSEIYAGVLLAFGDSGLTGSSTYCYRVRGTNAGGDSPYSSAIQITTKISAPASVSAADAAAATSVTFGSVSGADSYNLYWSNTAGVTSASNSVAGVTSIFNHTSLTAWLTYNYRVAAVKGGIVGMLSAEVSAHALPTVGATLADNTAGVFCPRINLSVTAAPGSATQYCVKENSSSSAGCVWTALPLPTVIRSSLPSTSVAMTVFLRDASSNIFLAGAGRTTGNVAMGATQLPADPATWAATITSSGITAPQIDELNCRVDQLTAAQGLSFANIRLPVYDATKRLKTSQQLNNVVQTSFGLTPTMLVAAAHKALWRLMMSTQATGGSLSILDISKIDLTGRNISDMDFAGSNITGAQLSGIDPTSYPLKISGLDLSGWSPAPTQTLTSMDVSNATNIPWAALNANANSSGYTFSNFSGVNLSGWNPPTASKVNFIDYTGASNIPWAALNANTNSGGYAYSNFSGHNLSAWSPPATSRIEAINYTGATNISWAALNANTHISGYQSSNFSGVNLSGWSPPVASRIDKVIYTGATNVPWAALNANTHSNGYSFSNFSGVNLSGWNPPVARRLDYITYAGASNIPWAALNANTHSNGYSYSNFSDTNLSGWSPPAASRIDRINYTNATNIPWAALNATTHSWAYISSNFSGVNLSGWNPPVARDIFGVNYTGATNIPWAALNANTHTNGYNGSNFSGVNLSGWSPQAARALYNIIYTGATNIPWAALNANTHASGYSGSNFSGVNLSGWNPAVGSNTSGIKYAGATNIPWAALNANTHANGYAASNFTGVNLSGWIPPAASSLVGINYTGATNIPWAALNANTHTSGFSSSIFSGLSLAGWNPPSASRIESVIYVGSTNLPWTAINANTYLNGYTNSVFIHVDLTGYDPSGKRMDGAKLPIGAVSPTDFVEATGITPSAGTTWIDLSKPWGP